MHWIYGASSRQKSILQFCSHGRKLRFGKPAVSSFLQRYLECRSQIGVDHFRFSTSGGLVPKDWHCPRDWRRPSHDVMFSLQSNSDCTRHVGWHQRDNHWQGLTRGKIFQAYKFSIGNPSNLEWQRLVQHLVHSGQCCRCWIYVGLWLRLSLEQPEGPSNP